MSLFVAIKKRFDTYQPLRGLGLPELRAFSAKDGDDSTLPYAVMVPLPAARLEAGTDFVYSNQEVHISIFHKDFEVLEKINEAMHDCFPDKIDLVIGGSRSVLSMRLTNESYEQESERVYRLDLEYDILLSRRRS